MKLKYRDSYSYKLTALGFIMLILLSHIAIIEILFGVEHSIWLYWLVILGFFCVFAGGLGLILIFIMDLLNEG